MQLKRSIAVAALALGAALPAFAADPVKIGLVLPMSGPFAAYGKQIEHGVKLYLATHGDTFGGRKVELILKDDSPGTSGDVSKRLAQELVVKDKVDILAGFGLTPSALAVAPLSAEAKIPMVVMNAATSIITTKSPYLVRTSHTLPQDTAPIASWAAKNRIKKVYTLVADYGPGQDAEAPVQEDVYRSGRRDRRGGARAGEESGLRTVPAEDQGYQAGCGLPVPAAGRRIDCLHEGLRRSRARAGGHPHRRDRRPDRRGRPGRDG